MNFIDRALYVVFFMSVLIVARHGYYFINAIIKSTAEEPVEYKLSSKALISLGLAIAYILTVIFKGITS